MLINNKSEWAYVKEAITKLIILKKEEENSDLPHKKIRLTALQVIVDYLKHEFSEYEKTEEPHEKF